MTKNQTSFKKGHRMNVGKYWKVSKEGRKRMSEGQKGKKLSKMHKEKIGLKSKGNKYALGNKHTEKTKQKLSLLNSGKNHPQWKGGITPYAMQLRNSKMYKIWRSKVFERDNWTCQTCQKRGVYLEAHHKIPFCQLLKTEFEYLIFDIENGVTLCEDCHNLTKLGGAT